MLKPARFFLLAVISVATLSSHAGVTSTSTTLQEMFETADLVIRGTVVSLSRGNVSRGLDRSQPEIQEFVAILSVERVYKGKVRHGNISVVFGRPTNSSCSVSRCEQLTSGEYGLFFLSLRDQQYRLSQQYAPYEVSKLKAQPSVQSFDGMIADLVAGLQDSEIARVLTNISLLGGTRTSSVTTAVRSLLPNRQIEVEGAAYVALLKSREYSRLRQAIHFVQQTTSSPALRHYQAEIIGMIEEIKDPAVVPILVEVADSRNDRLRGAIVHSLRMTASPQSVPTLIRALDDDVQVTRYDAVLGLATIEQAWSLAPSLDSFESNEARYVDAWKQWWKAAGKATYAK